MANPESVNGIIPIPPGLDALLDEMSCQILHHHPPDILSFLADYLEAKLRKRDGQLGPDETSGKHTGDSAKDGMQGDQDDKDVNAKDPYNQDQDTKNGTSGSASDKDSRLNETPSQKAQREQNVENGQNGKGQGQGQGQASNENGKKRKGNSLSTRIDQLSTVLADALDKGQQLGRFHGVQGPDGESGGGGKDADDRRRESMTVMRGNDKVTFRGSIVNAALGGGNVGGGNLDGGGGGPGQPGNGQQGGLTGAPHGDQKKLNSLSTRIEELSVVLADALGKGQLLSDFHKTTFAEQAEAAREAQAQLKVEAEQEWEKTHEMRERQETQRLVRQAEYMQMLIAQIEDMSQAVELALSVLGPIDSIDGHGLRRAKKSRSLVTFAPAVEAAEARKHSGELGKRNENRRHSDGPVQQLIPIVTVQRTSDGSVQAGGYDIQPPFVQQTTAFSGQRRNSERNEFMPTTQRPRDAQPDPNEQNVTRSIENNTPGQWRRIDLSGVGETLRQFFQNAFGHHIDTMKGVFWGEIAMSDAPVHSVILAISLGILVALGISFLRSLWRALY